MKACFIDVLCDLLDRGSSAGRFDTNVADRKLLQAAFGGSAVRVFDMLANRVRSQAVRRGAEVSTPDLVAQLRAPSAQGLRRTLAEAALAQDAAGTATVTGFVARRSGSEGHPLVRDLLTELRSSVAWRKRDTDRAVVDAFAAVMNKHFGSSSRLDTIHGRYGDDAVDLVLQLGATGTRQPLTEFRSGTSSRNFVDAVAALAARITPDPRPRLQTLADLAAKRDDAKPGSQTPFLVAPLTEPEQALLAAAPTLSLGLLATAHHARPPAIQGLLGLVRTRDTLSFDQALHAFPEVNGKGAYFFERLAAALDEKGGGTSATDEAVFPQALVEVLAPLATDDGKVSWQAVYDTYGGAAASWFGIVAAAVTGGSLGDVRAERSLSHVPSGLSEAAIAALGRSYGDVSFVDRMPALRTMSATFGANDALAGFEVVVAQHLFPTTMGLVAALQQNGLAKERLHLIGKSYSTHERTYAALRGQGFDVDESSRQDHNLAEDAAVRLAGAARRQLKKIFASVTPQELADPNARPRFLLFDEGGKLLETLHKEFPEYAKLCIGMEHTDRGMQLLDDLENSGGKVLLPVIDMARSEAKKKMESPAIGESAVYHTEVELEEAGISPRKKEACIIGYGAVGQATAAALKRRGYSVWVHDTDPASLARAKADGCEVPTGNDDERRRGALAHGHIVVSCTGRTTIHPDEFPSLLPDGAILVNAASGTHELGVHALGDAQIAARTAAESLRLDGQATTTFHEKPIATGPFLAPGKHRHLVFTSETKDPKTGKAERREHIVLRGGAVINMTRGMPPEVVQLTLGLVLTSILQAAKDGAAGQLRPGRITLGGKEQTFLIDAVEAALHRQGLPPLSAPDFRAVDAWG